jgi:hypothetical protein
MTCQYQTDLSALNCLKQRIIFKRNKNLFNQLVLSHSNILMPLNAVKRVKYIVYTNKTA